MLRKICLTVEDVLRIKFRKYALGHRVVVVGEAVELDTRGMRHMNKEERDMTLALSRPAVIHNKGAAWPGLPHWSYVNERS